MTREKRNDYRERANASLIHRKEDLSMEKVEKDLVWIFIGRNRGYITRDD